jgi:hypothetical protein
MKKFFDVRKFLGMGLLGSVVALSTGCPSGPLYVQGGTLCVQINSIEGAALNDVQDQETEITLRWRTQGVVHTRSATATIVGDTACIERTIGLGTGVFEDIEIDTVRVTLFHYDGTLTGFDSAPEFDYDSDSMTVEISAKVDLKKNAVEDQAVKAMNKLFEKGKMVIDRFKPAVHPRSTKNLPAEDLGGSSGGSASAGAAK